MAEHEQKEHRSLESSLQSATPEKTMPKKLEGKIALITAEGRHSTRPLPAR
jgi:hypothetical protein